MTLESVVIDLYRLIVSHDYNFSLVWKNMGNSMKLIFAKLYMLYDVIYGMFLTVCTVKLNIESQLKIISSWKWWAASRKGIRVCKEEGDRTAVVDTYIVSVFIWKGGDVKKKVPWYRLVSQTLLPGVLELDIHTHIYPPKGNNWY